MRALILLALAASLTAANKPKHIVLISGDEEYRSEEALPQLAKILSTRHGFHCTVLFAIDKQTGDINPDQRDNIPGLEALESADLMVIFTRFRDLPDSQMKHIVDYVESGRPIVAMRTATHAFELKSSPTYARYSWNSSEWPGGFGEQVLGSTWVTHHGKHGVQSTRGILVKGEERIRYCAAFAMARSGDPLMSTKSTCRCPVTASRWFWARCSKACTRTISRFPARQTIR